MGDGSKEDANQARAQFDADLGVLDWQVSARVQRMRPPVETGAPSWWFGDEEASQSFLRDPAVASRLH